MQYKDYVGLTPLFGDRRGFKPAQLKTKIMDSARFEIVMILKIIVKSK